MRPSDRDAENILWDIAVRKGATECGQPTSSFRFAPCTLPPKHPGQAHRSRFDLERKTTMHYRNGREAKNGDRVVQLDAKGRVAATGILYDATPGNDYCNGSVAHIEYGTGACMVDCLHADDLAAILAEKGLDKRPDGK